MPQITEKDVMEDSFFINSPVFLKYKRRFNWETLKRQAFIKKVLVNERIVEIPFVIKALSMAQEGCKVLDLGCMESLLPLFISGLGYDVTGFDFRNYPYKAPNFKFVQGSIMNLPFDNAHFDVVTCVSTIEHIGIGFYNDPKEGDSPDIIGMKEARRVLKPGGLLILTVPFGKAFVNNQQRIYDRKSLDRLILGFSLKEIRFFRNVAVADGNNYWERIEQKEAESVQYDSGTECVSLLSAINTGL